MFIVDIIGVSHGHYIMIIIVDIISICVSACMTITLYVYIIYS